jgi:ubiquinone/menaquinone biosynthesis C-methylase UbiE
MVAFMRHRHAAAMGHTAAGGILVGDAFAYDLLSRLLLRRLYRRIAADVAEAAAEGARVLEVGCGPGHLSVLLADGHGCEVIGLDLDPAMIERARVKTARVESRNWRRPMFVVGDVASLPYRAGTFDIVVSTLSMHHWADPAAGLAEIRRVLSEGARALVWDFRPGAWPIHRLPDPIEHIERSLFGVVGVTSWRWPWRFKLIRRIELVPTFATAAESPT